jgi:uridine kinase
LNEFTKIKGIIYIDDNINIFENEYNNISKNWYKFKIITQIIDINNYDIVIKTRPDLHIIDTKYNFNNFINDENTINIPYNNDIFNKELFEKYNYINDQMSIFNIKLLNKLSKLYDNIEIIANTYNLPYVSEIIFYKFLEINNIIINRVNINYKLILSECNIIAICGDSGSGKTTLSNIIGPLLPTSDLLILETDRYHKWERGNQHYNNYTHLNPYANNLEKMNNDIYNLKIGNNIYEVDYDHTNGKFTQTQQIDNKTNIIICGLHTLYDNNIHSLLDLRIFVDTDRNLIREWKIERDINKRGYNKDKVLELINKREEDYIKYIDIQKENANIIINYFKDNNNNLNLIISIDKSLFNKIPYFITNYNINDKFININIDKEYITPAHIKIQYNNIYDGYFGFIQTLIYFLIYENK